MPPARIIPQASPTAKPTDSRLIAYFGTAQAQENFTRSVLDLSDDVLARFYALEELARRWPPGHPLTPVAQAQLETMIANHAAGIRRSESALEEMLAPMMTSFGFAGTSGTPNSNATAWQQASALGLQAAQRTDKLLRSLLTSSDAPIAPDHALPRLQQSLLDTRHSVGSLVPR
jgi:hypothetical protein